MVCSTGGAQHSFTSDRTAGRRPARRGRNRLASDPEHGGTCERGAVLDAQGAVTATMERCRQRGPLGRRVQSSCSRHSGKVYAMPIEHARFSRRFGESVQVAERCNARFMPSRLFPTTTAPSGAMHSVPSSARSWPATPRGLSTCLSSRHGGVCTCEQLVHKCFITVTNFALPGRTCVPCAILSLHRVMVPSTPVRTATRRPLPATRRPLPAPSASPGSPRIRPPALRDNTLVYICEFQLIVI
jgi:hypothetical protein